MVSKKEADQALRKVPFEAVVDGGMPIRPHAILKAYIEQLRDDLRVAREWMRIEGDGQAPCVDREGHIVNSGHYVQEL